MTKYILTSLLALVLSSGMPIMAETSANIEIIDFEQVSVVVESGSLIRVANANGMMLTVYDIAGKPVKSIRIDNNDKNIDLGLSKGCYIVKVGKVVRKISIS